MIWSQFFLTRYIGCGFLLYWGQVGKNARKYYFTVTKMLSVLILMLLKILFTVKIKLLNKLRNFFIPKTISYSEICTSLCTAWFELAILNSVKLLHFFLTVLKYYSNTIWVFKWKFRPKRSTEGTLQSQRFCLTFELLNALDFLLFAARAMLLQHY